MSTFTDYINYYRDCVFEDDSSTLLGRVRTNDYAKDDYVRIKGDELTSRNPVDFTVIEKAEIQQFIITTLGMGQERAFWYGFPVSYTKSNDGEFLKPIFYIPIKYNNDKTPIIEDFQPLVNKDALILDWGIDIINLKKFVDDEIIKNEKISLLELSIKFKQYFPELYYDNNVNNKRIYFKGIFLSSELSKFTKGLYEELSSLRNRQLTNSSLKYFFEDYTESTTKNNFDIKEIFDLNENQKKSVESAFSNQLTVVWGPPGTGKSQVVASIILNAALNNETVLFASKNHQAVRVVEDKIKNLVGQPYLIRLGKKFEDKKDLFRPALYKYLDSILNNNPDINNENILKEIEDKIGLLKEEKVKILNELESLRNKRNVVQRNFNQFENRIVKIGKDKAEAILIELKKTNSINKKKLLNTNNKIAAQYIKSLNDIHKTKHFEDVWEKLEKVNIVLKDKSVEYFKLWHDSLPLRLNANDLDRRALSEYVDILRALDGDLPSNDFRTFMERKEVLMTQIKPFLCGWCITNLSTRREIPLVENFFDIVIIDEASQCDIASAIPLLYRAKRAVILGDPFQLKHISSLGNRSITLLNKNKIENIKYDYVEQSIYLLAEQRIPHEKLIQLNEHFRSHADIISFSISKWYNREQKKDCFPISTDYRKLFPKIGENESAVEWIDVKGEIKQINGRGAFIEEEIDMVVKVINVLKKKYINTKTEYGIATPFNLQADKIKRKINDESILIDTVHSFQGEEKDIMIFSPVIAEKMPIGPERYIKDTGFLLNVAITRAKAKLIIVGNIEACLKSKIDHIVDFANYVNNNKGQVEDKIESIYEQILYDAMKDARLQPIPQYVESQYRLDFALIDNDKKIKIDIEVDGKEYHTDWSGERLKYDIIRNQRLQYLGWKVLRFWTYEIRDNIEYCLERIKKELDN